MINVSLGSRIRTGSLINRMAFHVFRRVLMSLNFRSTVLTKPQLCCCFWKFDSRYIHAGKKCYDGERVVTHLAEQEIALSALRRLELAVNKFKRARKLDLELVLKGNLKYIFTNSKDVTFLIRCCGSLLANESLQVRRIMANAVWDKIRNASIPLENEHFEALLKTNLENCSPVFPKQFLSEMKGLGIEPSEETLRMLLWCVNVGEKSEENMLFFEELKSRETTGGFEFDGTLASVLAEQGKILEAEDIVSSMKKRQVDVASSVYASMVKGRIMGGEKGPVLELLAQMEKNGVMLLPSEYASVVSKLAEVSSTLPETKSKQLMDSVMPRISIPHTEDMHHRMLNTIVELLYCGKGNAACQLILSLPRSFLTGEKFDEPLPIVFCKELARVDIAPEEVLKMCDHLEEFMVALLKREESPEPLTLHIVAGYALQYAKSELSLFLLEALKQRGAPLRPHYFWPLFLIAAKEVDSERREEVILNVLRKMISLGVMINSETLAVYVLPFTKQRASAFDVLTLLQQNGLSGAPCRTAVTHWLLDKGELAEAVKLNNIHRGRIDPSPLVEPLTRCILRKIDKPDGTSLSSVANLLNSMSKKKLNNIDYTGEFLLELSEKLGFFENNGVLGEGQGKALDYLLRILKVLNVKNISISPQASQYLFNVLSPHLELNEVVEETMVMPPTDDELILPSSEFQPLIPHPRDMSVEELEGHLLELRHKGLNDRGVLRRLLQLYCRKKNLKRALEVKEDMEFAGHSFSPGMLSSLLDLLTQNNELEKAKDLFLQLKSDYPTFRLDEYKVIDLAALMCRRGFVNEGMELLQRHAESTKVYPGPSFERNLLNLFLSVHQQSGREREKKGGAGEQSEACGWTLKALMDELARLGYVKCPPPASMKTKLKEVFGFVLPS